MPSMPELPDMPDFLPDLSLPTFYKDDINQGSVLDRFKINQLKVGISQAQVKNLIGSPSVVDPFHNNQWNYINHSTLHGKNDIHYRLTLTFNNNKLVGINTSGIDSLPALTDKEKELEDKRIAEEKASIEAAKQAKSQAEKIAKEKAQAAEEQRIANEKIELAQTKQQEADQKSTVNSQEIKIKKSVQKTQPAMSTDTDNP
ncbi:Outer membrane lipoprotein SmpA, a component of the essential YaeT outer-membrane protein assembly complex [uncultured Candidatus Thioglobus sp.]|nr:Outer membrane lipoprotein SmpA, a component of the essential YaeT outer-membrane protein assembly complex [uncultured Candidatus Thioglobus sp.]